MGYAYNKLLQYILEWNYAYDKLLQYILEWNYAFNKLLRYILEWAMHTISWFNTYLNGLCIQ